MTSLRTGMGLFCVCTSVPSKGYTVSVESVIVEGVSEEGIREPTRSHHLLCAWHCIRCVVSFNQFIKIRKVGVIIQTHQMRKMRLTEQKHLSWGPIISKRQQLVLNQSTRDPEVCAIFMTPSPSPWQSPSEVPRLGASWSSGSSQHLGWPRI